MRQFSAFMTSVQGLPKLMALSIACNNKTTVTFPVTVLGRTAVLEAGCCLPFRWIGVAFSTDFATTILSTRLIGHRRLPPSVLDVLQSLEIEGYSAFESPGLYLQLLGYLHLGHAEVHQAGSAITCCQCILLDHGWHAVCAPWAPLGKWRLPHRWG